MKKFRLFVWISFIILAGVSLAWWMHSSQVEKMSEAQAPAAAIRTAPNSPVVAQIVPRVYNTAKSRLELWQTYRLMQQKVIEKDPDLAAEYKQLQAEMEVQRKKLEAAIVRVDPKTAAIIAKYHAMRERRMAATDVSASKSAAPSNQPK